MWPHFHGPDADTDLHARHVHPRIQTPNRNLNGLEPHVGTSSLPALLQLMQLVEGGALTMIHAKIKGMGLCVHRPRLRAEYGLQLPRDSMHNVIMITLLCNYCPAGLKAWSSMRPLCVESNYWVVSFGGRTSPVTALH